MLLGEEGRWENMGAMVKPGEELQMLRGVLLSCTGFVGSLKAGFYTGESRMEWVAYQI